MRVGRLQQCQVHKECQDAYVAGDSTDSEPCAHCKAGLAAVIDKFSGDVLQFGEGGDKVHAECKDAYLEAKSSACTQCGKPITGASIKYSNGDRIHPECKDEYVAATSESCAQCKGPIAVIEGKFSGSFMIHGENKIHQECMDAYQAAMK
mmetsp:Transcript_49176/g.115530  ORF Transcript_49176/g.115530 Transcript_49176/m.115530 type:complete len:150 (+) Transcript_49176:567-1016(+)